MSGSIRVKICGIQSADEALEAVRAGADLIGLNFVPESPRCIDVRTADTICEAVGSETVETVALFSNAVWEEMDRVLRRVDFDRVQLHGDETEQDVEAVDLPVIKALRGADLAAAQAYPGAILLLDHPTGGAGKGLGWDWGDASALVEQGYDVILAGGLDPTNVERAVTGLGGMSPWGVDVATGVEAGDYRKDKDRMVAFVEAVRRAEVES